MPRDYPLAISANTPADITFAGWVATGITLSDDQKMKGVSDTLLAPSQATRAQVAAITTRLSGLLVSE